MGTQGSSVDRGGSPSSVLGSLLGVAVAFAVGLGAEATDGSVEDAAVAPGDTAIVGPDVAVE